MRSAFLPADANTDGDTSLAGAQARCARAEAALSAAEARIAALEQQLASTASSARRHHTQLTALVQNLQAGLVLVDENHEIQFVNQYFWDLFGLPAVAGPSEGAPPIPHAAVMIDDVFADPAAFTKRARELHTTGQTVLQEAFALADGRVVELDYLVLDQIGAGRLICYRDVTERHRRDAEIRALAYIPQRNPNPIMRLSAEGEIHYSNPAAELLLPVLANPHPDNFLWPRLLAQVRTALPASEPVRQELAIGERHYLVTAVPVPGKASAMLYLTDITARHWAEQQLGEQRAFYESVLERVPTAVSVFDAEYRYLFVNEAVEPNPEVRAWMLGKTNEEAWEYRQRPPGPAARRRALFEEAKREQREVAWEEVLTYTNGTPRHLLMRFRPITAPDGHVQLMICSGTDISERKEAEENMARQQEFYESILNLLPVDIAVFDAAHRFLFVNPSSIADPEVRQQVIGLTNAEYFALRNKQQPAGIEDQRAQYFELAVRTRTDVTWEEMRTDRLRRAQLIVRHLRPVFDADGSLRMVVGSGIDITARYTAERLQNQVQVMLQEQQAFIRQIVDTLPNILFIVEPDGSISFANHAYQALDASTAHRRTTPENDPVVWAEKLEIEGMSRHVQQTGEALTRELPFTLSTGQTLYYQVHKRPMQRAGGQRGVLTISTDVTAVKQARHELERREKQYRDLVTYSHALICTHDSQGVLLSVNPAIERLMGVPAAQLVGRNISVGLPPEYHAALREYLAAGAPARAQEQPEVVTIITAAGERRYLHYYAFPVQEEGQAPYVVASGYDVTPAVVAQRALQLAKQEAEANAQAKEAFLARMSHEIRTPLNGVLGMAALLQKTELTDPQREYLRTMQHAGRHLLALLNDVLDMAKITAQHLHLNHAPFNVAVALEGAGQAVAALAAERGLALVVEPLRTARPLVVGDAYRLHQVLLNLLGNAIKFTQQGRVRLGADVLDDTGAALALRFWVEDTGIGMTPEEQAHIFEAFAQASGETSHRFGGTGLGLAISQQLVGQMGGALDLHSVPGQGTTFFFDLSWPRPAVEAAATHAAPSAATTPATYDGLRGLRVLLAEDNLVNQQIAVAVLEYWGVRVQAVSNGLDALAQLQSCVFDAALLDIRMPGLSGVEVTTAIRAHPDATTANVPIVAVTANAFEADRTAYLAAGMNACLTKPYEEADLCLLLLKLTAA